MFAVLRRWFSTDPGGTPAGGRGTLYVVSAPSGAGKTSLVKALLERDAGIEVSVSYTTRPRRASEVEGRDYYFVDAETFARLEGEGRLLESADVFGNRYGTGRDQVDETLATGRHVILEIDWQGARQVRSAQPACRTVFILPPSRRELERRLRGRATDSDEVIARRLAESMDDMSHWPEFDYLVVNDDFDEALAALAAIVAGRGDVHRSNRPEVAETARAILDS